MKPYIKEYFKSFKIKEKCILCGSSNSEELVKRKIPTLGLIAHHICNECGLIFINPKPSFQATEDYYSSYGSGIVNNNAKLNDPYDFKSWTWKSNTFLRQLNFFIKKNFIDTKKKIDVFELGAGAGIHLKVLQERFNVNSAYASEPGDGYSDLFKHFNPTAHLTKSTAFYDCPTLKDINFDLIFCRGTFEHTYYPEKILEGIRKKLKPSGIFWLMMPLSWCPIRNPDWWFPWDHFYSYNKMTIKQLLEKNGFKVLLVDNLLQQHMMQVIAIPSEKYGYVPYPNRKKMVAEFKQRIYNFIETKGEDYNYPSLYIKFKNKIKKYLKINS